MSAKRIPIARAREIGEKYGQSQVIIVTWEPNEGRTHVVTWGKTLADCDEAAQGGNFVKKALGWPDEHCQAVPARVRKKLERRK